MVQELNRNGPFRAGRWICRVVIILFGSIQWSNAQGIRISGFDRDIPDPFLMSNGARVTSPSQWYSVRRPELLKLFTRDMYGQSPGKPEHMVFQVLEEDHHALNGTATRKQIAVYFTGKKNGPQMDILLYLPNKIKGPAPVFIGLNFAGNQTIDRDTAVHITNSWEYGGNKGVVDHHATAASRGEAADRWPLDTILGRGYGVATVYAGDIAPDEEEGYKTAVQSLYPELQSQGNNFATIAAWAWGLRRVMDYFETDHDVDPHKVAVFGWSRMGKAALWAGAQDTRFALVISNESGAGGAKLFHHFSGEDIQRLCTKFPHWFCHNFNHYIGRDTLLPFDQNELVALIAPRPVYIASAQEDSNSDPLGEFLTAAAVDTVYRFLGTDGLPVKTMPPVNQSVLGAVSYHIRTGKHNITPYDWDQYLRFADKFLSRH